MRFIQQPDPRLLENQRVYATSGSMTWGVITRCGLHQQIDIYFHDDIFEQLPYDPEDIPQEAVQLFADEEGIIISNTLTPAGSSFEQFQADAEEREQEYSDLYEECHRLTILALKRNAAVVDI